MAGQGTMQIRGVLKFECKEMEGAKFQCKMGGKISVHRDLRASILKHLDKKYN